jgi:ribosome-associated protein
MESEAKGLIINERLIIPEEELHFTASRSSGPGGQNVNKVSTRITLWFDVLHSSSLSAEEKQQIIKAFPTRINKAGILRISAQQTRSQITNRELAKSRFVELLQQALIKFPSRKKPRVPQRVREQRIAQKKKRGKLKFGRSPRALGEWE